MYQKVKAYMKEHGMVVDGDVSLPEFPEEETPWLCWKC